MKSINTTLLWKLTSLIIPLSLLTACAGPAVFGPAGGIIIPSKEADNYVDEKLVIFSNNIKTELRIYCYKPKDSQPWIARAGLHIKALVFSRDDNKSCQFIGISQLEITQQFANAASKLNNNTSIQPTAISEKQYTTKSSPLDAKAQLRNHYAAALLNIHEYNCRSFLASAFSTRALADTQKDFISALGTGISSGTALTSPHLSSAVGLTNLVYGSGVDSVSKNIYLDKTTEALSTAIQSSRISNRNTILTNLKNSYEEYPIDSLLSDIKVYEGLCSVTAGAAELNRIATQKLTETAANAKNEPNSNLESSQSNLSEGQVKEIIEALKMSKDTKNKQSAINQLKRITSVSPVKLPQINEIKRANELDQPIPVIVPNKVPTTN